MRFLDDRRGQSVVIGTVILFGFLIVALAVYQAQIVPTENADVEFDHSQQVEEDVIDLRNAVLSAGDTGSGRSTSVSLGTRYPRRTFFVNPPPATGSLETTDPREVRIENVSVDAEGNVALYWENRTNGTAIDDLETRSVRYEPDYHEFDTPPNYVYEHSLVVAESDGAAVARTGQTTVRADRNRISLSLLDGELSEQGVQRTSVDPETLSQNRGTVTLESAGGDPIVLVLPTAVADGSVDDVVDAWEDRLGDDAAVTADGDEVRIALDASETYRLGMSNVGVGRTDDTTDESDGYITEVSRSGGVAVAEVRDRYNNPVEDATVSIGYAANGTPIANESTDTDGRVRYEHDGAPIGVNMTINGVNGPDWESVTFEDLGAGTGDGGDGGNEINPIGENELLLAAAYSQDNDDTNAVFRLRNPGDEDRTLEEVRLSVYYGSTTGSGGGGQGEIEQREATVVETGDQLELRGDFVTLASNVTIPAGQSRELTLDFPETVTGDLLGVSFIDDRGSRGLYLSGVIEEPPAEFAVTIDGTNSPVEAGSTLGVTATAENTGSEPDTQSLNLTIDGEVVDTTDEFTLDPGGTNQETLSWTTADGDAGEYTATVSSDNGFDSTGVEVVAQGEPAGNVDVQDTIVETDGDFDVTTSDYLNIPNGFVVVANDRTGDSTSFTTDEDTNVVDAADVGGLQGGDEITATLYEDDTRSNELDSDATVVSEVTQADRVSYVAGTAGGGGQGFVDFDLRNDGDDSVELTGFRLDSSDPQADSVDNDGDNEFDGAGGTLNVGGAVSFGNMRTLDTSATIVGGSQETFTVGSFQGVNNTNNFELTVTFEFSDGSTLTVTMTT